MIEEFIPLSKVDIPAFEKFNEELKEILVRLDDNTIFDENYYSEESYKKLLLSFVNNQRNSLGRTKPGSWSLVPDDTGMDSDVRVDFIFLPTYLVTAILSRTLCDYPTLLKSIPNYHEAIKKGMIFCSYRKLFGHGYEMDSGAAEALTILSMGKVPYLLENDKDLCPELFEAIKDVTNEIKERLETNTTHDSWGVNLQEEFSSALETFYVKNDKELYERIKNIGKDSKFLKMEDLPW